MENLAEVLVAFVLIISLFLMAFTLWSYQRTGSRKLLFVLGAFALFTLKGLLMTLALFTDLLDLELEPSLLLLDVFILISLYIMIIKK